MHYRLPSQRSGSEVWPCLLGLCLPPPPPSVTTCEVAYNIPPAGRLDGYTSNSSTLLEYYSLPQQFHGTSLGAKGSSHPRLGLQVLPPWNEEKKACTIGYLHRGVGLRYGPAFLASACLPPPLP